MNKNKIPLDSDTVNERKLNINLLLDSFWENFDMCSYHQIVTNSRTPPKFRNRLIIFGNVTKSRNFCSLFSNFPRNVRKFPIVAVILWQSRLLDRYIFRVRNVSLISIIVRKRIIIWGTSDVSQIFRLSLGYSFHGQKENVARTLFRKYAKIEHLTVFASFYNYINV